MSGIGAVPTLHLVPGLLFDGTPCEIALEDTAVGRGSSARIRRGYLLGNDPFVVAVKVFGELLDDAKQQLLVRELLFAREVSWSHLSIVAFLGTAMLGEQTALVSLYCEVLNYYRVTRHNVLAVTPNFLAPNCELPDFSPMRGHKASGTLKTSPGLFASMSPETSVFTACVTGHKLIAYMKNGNLMEYIKSSPGCDKKKLILQVADAVGFLHLEKKLVHGDLKCENVLVSDYGHALLADFGLSSFIEKSEGLSTTMTAIRAMNTLQFAAPELLGLIGDNKTPVSKKTTQSDMYAFGMLVLEAISEQPPWGEMNNFAVITSVAARLHPPRPTLDGTFVAMSHCWWDICRSCWCFDPHERLQISDVLRALNASEFLPRREFRLEGERPKTAAYMPNGQTIVIASQESIQLVDTASGDVRELDRPGNVLEHHISGLAVSPDGRHIACAVDDTVRVLNAASGVLVTSLQHDGPVSFVAYSRDSSRIASSTSRSDGTVRLWDAATGDFSEWTVHRDTHRVFAVSFAPDGICLAAACGCGTIHIGDSIKCATVVTLAVSPLVAPIWAVDYSPDGTRIVAANDDTILLFEGVHAGLTAQHSFGKHAVPAFRDVVFSPSGKYVAFTSCSRIIEIWDVQNECTVGAPKLIRSESFISLKSVAFSPDGRSIVSALWDILTTWWHS